MSLTQVNAKVMYSRVFLGVGNSTHSCAAVHMLYGIIGHQEDIFCLVTMLRYTHEVRVLL